MTRGAYACGKLAKHAEFWVVLLAAVLATLCKTAGLCLQCHMSSCAFIFAGSRFSYIIQIAEGFYQRFDFHTTFLVIAAVSVLETLRIGLAAFDRPALTYCVFVAPATSLQHDC